MAGETPTAPAAPAQTPAPDAQQPGHHSQRQPRDDAKRFAGPPTQGTPDAQAAGVPPSRLKRTFTENGQPVTVELSEDELWQEYQRARASQYKEKAATERFQRASEIAKKAQVSEQVAQALVAGDPDALEDYFEKNGKDPADALADVLEAILKKREMTPEQRENAKLRAENAAIKEEQRRSQEEAETRAFQDRVDRIRPELEKVWSHALAQENLPKTEATMERAAEIFLTALSTGQRLSPEQVAELTRLELVEAQKGLVESMEPTHLFQHFPGALKKLDESLSPEEFEQRLPNLAKRYWGHLAAKVRGNARRGAPAPAGTSRPAPKPQEEGGLEAMDPYFANKLRARQG
jgi:hypothetical protein